MYKYDPCSCILHPEDRLITLEHYHLAIKPDFETKTLSCVCAYTFSSNLDQAPFFLRVSFDIFELNVDLVYDIKTHVPLSFQRLKNPDSSVSDVCSQYLEIKFPSAYLQEGKITIGIEWNTLPECSAIQWLSKIQTHTKKYPYVYTQFQAIHARALFPCFDSPSFKCSYSAAIDLTNYPGMNAVMSGIRAESAAENIIEYHQPIPIPCYLVAFAIGNIKGLPIGPRSTVYGEPGIVELAASEFSETENYLSAAEKVTGIDYFWGKYDILVLPPGFPFGGMENPCLTFVTPSLLTGDKSLVDVIIHEICHSWTGNSITSITWEHFWLNEGWTMFLERLIISKIHGEPSRHFSALVGLEELRDAVIEYESKCKPSPWTRLVVDLSNGKDPDDAFSKVPYEKGHTLLYHLESVVGKEPFTEYLKGYLRHFTTKSISTHNWLTHLLASFPKGTFDTVNWDEWLYGYGMPPIIPKYDTSMLKEAIRLAEEVTNTDFLVADFTSQYHLLSVWQKVSFFKQMSKNHEKLDHDRLKEMFTSFSLSSLINAEILLAWLVLTLTCGVIIDVDQIKSFLSKHGRMYYLRTVYCALAKVDPPLAIEIFVKNKESYHPVTNKMIFKDLAPYFN